MNFEEWMLKVAVEQKVITANHIKKACEFQQHYLKQGQNIPLGNILVNSGYLEASQLIELQQQFQQLSVLAKDRQISSPEGTAVVAPPPDVKPAPKKSNSASETSGISAPSPQKTIGVAPPAGVKATSQESTMNIPPPPGAVVDPGMLKLEMEDNSPTVTVTGDEQEEAPSSMKVRAIGKKFGKYKIIRKLGQGNVGQVYLVHDPQLNREVALKVLLAGEMADEINIARFRREAQAIAKLNHPNIVRVYDIGEVDEVQYFTMDYIPGKSLRDMLKGSKKRQSARKAAAITAKLARALDYAHKNNIVHRDIKPANILINEDEPYLMDFGLARDIKGGDKVSHTGTIAGTAAYMAPEQAKGKGRQIDGRTDIYSLGTTFYEMLVGHVPFPGKDLMAILQKVIYDPPIAPRQLNPNMPQELEKICLKTLQKKKEDRYATAAVLAEDLEKYLAQREKGGSGIRSAVAIPSGASKTLAAVVLFLLLAIVWLWSSNSSLTAKYSKAKTALGKAVVKNKKLENEESVLKLRLKKKEQQHQQMLQEAQNHDLKIKKMKKSLEQANLNRVQLEKIVRELQQQIKSTIKTEAKRQNSWWQFRASAANTGFYNTLGINKIVRLKWKFKTNGGVFSSPAIYKNTLYFGSDDGKLYAINSKGQKKWAFPTKGPIGSSPTIAYKKVYFASADGKIYAINTKDGQIKWAFHTQGRITASPAVFAGTVYCGSVDKYFYAINAQNGELKWKFATGDAIWSSAAIANDLIYFGSNDGKLYALNNNGKKKWAFQTQSWVSSSPAIEGSFIYFGSRDGKLYALNARTGEFKWSFKSKSQIASSPAVYNSTIYIGSNDRRVYAVDAYTGRLQWQFKTGNKVFASPTITKDIVYCGSVDGKLYALNARSGHLLWEYKAQGAVAGSAIVHNNSVYFGCYDNCMYALLGKKSF